MPVDFVKTEEVVTMCHSSALKGVVGSPPLTDITMLTSTTADRTCYLEGSRLAAGRRSKKMKATTFKATGFEKQSYTFQLQRQFGIKNRLWKCNHTLFEHFSLRSKWLPT